MAQPILLDNDWSSELSDAPSSRYNLIDEFYFNYVDEVFRYYTVP
jgi:hypothetical protein